jgi:hypothetical protein
MKARAHRALVSGVEIAGVVACILFWGVPVFAQKTPQQANVQSTHRLRGAGPAPGSREMSQPVNPPLYTGASVDKNALSEEESREYTSLVNDLQRKLDDAAQEFQRKVQSMPPTFVDRNLSAVVGDWFRTIDYVKAAQAERPLFLSDPPQMRVHLQVELKSKRVVRDDVVFSLSLQPRILY